MQNHASSYLVPRGALKAEMYSTYGIDCGVFPAVDRLSGFLFGDTATEAGMINGLINCCAILAGYKTNLQLDMF